MGVGRTIKTLLKETFAAPLSESYVVEEPDRSITLREGGDYSGRDLSNLDLTGISLQNASLRGATLRGTILKGANLRNVDLTGADLAGAVLSGANLENAKIDVSGLLKATIVDPPSGVSPEELDLLKSEA